MCNEFVRYVDFTANSCIFKTFVSQYVSTVCFINLTGEELWTEELKGHAQPCSMLFLI
jgi:hypothetical protein